MSKPAAESIIADAKKLKEDRFQQRDLDLVLRANERYNRTKVEVPKAYERTAKQHNSNIIEDEGRQVTTLVYSVPVPHVSPPTPEDQPITTKTEQFLAAMLEELERKNGPVWWQCTSAQVHDKVGFVYFGQKRKPYKGQPASPEGDDIVATAEWGIKNDRYKKDAGINAVFDYRFVPTNTAYWTGNVYDPHCFYEIKEVSERELMKVYGVEKTSSGGFTKRTSDETTLPSGYPMDDKGSETRLMVVEYWDRDYCAIVVETSEKKWLNTRQVNGAFVLEEWKHGWGRVPFFARPCFVTEQMDEDKKFASPLDGIHNEMAEHKILRTMLLNIARQISFASYQIVSKETGEVIVDDNGLPLIFLELEAAKARQLAPGQEIKIIPQAPELSVLFQEIAASEARLQRYQLSPVSKGIAPGADSANAMISNLHRFQLSTLDPLAQQASLQASALDRFALERVREMAETVFVFAQKSKSGPLASLDADTYLSLNAEEIVSVNVQAKATPDQGQFQLLIEKHAMELWLAGAITELEFHEMRGKENPEEYVVANQVERLRKTLDPIILQQVVASLGMMDAVNAMIQENAQSGDARNAVPGMMQQAEGMQQGQAPTGMGQGSEGQPRTPGTRMPTQDVNTQAVQAGGC